MSRREELIKVARESHEALDAHDGQGILALATGVGKTKICLDYLVNQGELKILWVVPTEKLRDEDVPNEWKKWEKLEYFNKHVTTICYASLPTVQGETYDYIVLDEAHRLTDLKYSFFMKNKVSKIICLTATPPHEVEKRHLLHHLLKLKVIKRVTIDEAVDRHLIAPYKITCIGVRMSQDKNIKWGKRTVSERARYNYWDRKIDYMEVARQRVPQEVRLARMHAIYKAPSKVITAKKWVENNLDPNERMILFSSSIANAESLESSTFHSKRNSEDYDKFNQGLSNRISVVKVLDEGVNLYNVEGAVFTQVISNERNLIQRLGRTVRWRQGHESKVIIFYYLNTVDETWVYRAVQGLDPKRIQWKTIENNKV